MVKLTIEDIIFWIFILIIIGTAIWLLSGSPPEMDALISIGLAVAASELLIWKKMFSVEEKTIIGFMKIKNDMNKNNLNVSHRFDRIEDKLNMINSKLKIK